VRGAFLFAIIKYLWYIVLTNDTIYNDKIEIKKVLYTWVNVTNS
jgi:hypothetical protein